MVIFLAQPLSLSLALGFDAPEKLHVIDLHARARAVSRAQQFVKGCIGNTGKRCMHLKTISDYTHTPPLTSTELSVRNEG